MSFVDGSLGRRPESCGNRYGKRSEKYPGHRGQSRVPIQFLLLWTCARPIPSGKGMLPVLPTPHSALKSEK